MQSSHPHLARFSSPEARPRKKATIPDSVATLYARLPELGEGGATAVGGHLAYVESLLRMRSTRHLDAAQAQMRELLLDLLLVYTSSASMPRRTAQNAASRPCFVGKNGELCPVGFILARTAGFEFASQVCSCEDLQQLHPDLLLRLNAWMQASGFSAEEFNMIQPGFVGLPASPAPKARPIGVHPRFERLMNASQARVYDYLTRAFVGTRNLLSLHELDASKAFQHISSITLANVFGPVVENGHANPTSATGNELNPELKFSRTF